MFPLPLKIKEPLLWRKESRLKKATMAVSTSIGSILLLSLICFLPSFSSAKLILKGETLEFPPCPTKPYLPIFEFRPHGSTNYLTYAYGTQPRPATPDRFNARLGKTDDGGKLTSLRYTRKVRWGLAKRANFEIDKGREPVAQRHDVVSGTLALL